MAWEIPIPSWAGIGMGLGHSRGEGPVPDALGQAVLKSPCSGSRSRAHSCRAFTLVDVIVTLAVVALLIGLLMPGFASVRETSRRVMCASNLRQIGFGLTLYADMNRDYLPSSEFLHGDKPRGDSSDSGSKTCFPSEMMTLRLPGQTMNGPERWDGLGMLYSNEFLPAPQVFYCPSHWGTHPFSRYIPHWKGQNGAIVGNYHFRGVGPNGSRRLSRIEPSRAAIVTDGLKTRQDFNHKVGLNILRADISLSWLSDGGRLFEYLPADESSSLRAEDFELLWDQIDHPERDILPQRRQ